MTTPGSARHAGPTRRRITAPAHAGEAEPEPEPAHGAWAQLRSVLKVGLVGFGGGSALIPLFDDELVQRRKVIDARTFTRHTVVASITPGALPVKLGGLAGLHTSGAWLALVLATAVALPGTAMTVLLVASVASGGQAAVRYVELASVGITVFIVALLVHYIDKVVRGGGTHHLAAVGITAVAFAATGLSQTVELAGHLVGRDWSVDLPRLSAVQLIGAALLLIAARSLARRDRRDGTARGGGQGRDPRILHAALLFTATGVAAVVIALVFLGLPALSLLGLVALSTVTSFGGGEAYVGVADGFFVAGGYVSSSVFYSQLVPIANALPGPILVKLAAGVAYGATAPGQGPAAGWVMAAAASLVAIASCTAIAVVVMGAYHRAETSPVVRDIGRYILPVICGLLVTTSVSMLNASAEVSTRAGAPVAAVLWLSITGIVLATILRHRRTVPDVVLLLACGAASLGGLLAT